MNEQEDPVDQAEQHGAQCERQQRKGGLRQRDDSDGDNVVDRVQQNHEHDAAAGVVEQPRHHDAHRDQGHATERYVPPWSGRILPECHPVKGRPNHAENHTGCEGVEAPLQPGQRVTPPADLFAQVGDQEEWE